MLDQDTDTCSEYSDIVKSRSRCSCKLYLLLPSQTLFLFYFVTNTSILVVLFSCSSPCTPALLSIGHTAKAA